MESNLEKIVAEMVEVEKVANVDVDAVDWRARAGFEVARREAQDRLALLKDKYGRALLPTLLSFPLIGKPEAQAKFAEIANQEVKNSLVVVYADALYKRLAGPVEAAFGPGREFNVTQFIRLRDEVVAVGRELGLRSLAGLKFEESGALKTPEDVVAYVRRVILSGPGPELNQAYVSHLIRQAAMLDHHTSAVLPVVVVGLADMAEAQALAPSLGRIGAYVTLPDEVTSEFVLGTFTQTKEKLKQKKYKNTTNPDTNSETN